MRLQPNENSKLNYPSARFYHIVQSFQSHLEALQLYLRLLQPIMGPRVKRRRLNYLEDLSDDICQPASRLEKDSWNGFCEIESEPVRLLGQ